MKVIKVNLNEYISPRAIEKMRYKKFNAPQINDGNLLCDDFFRQEELFDNKNDIVDYWDSRYGIDDILPIDRTSIRAFDERNLFGSNTNYIESDLPYYVDIIGENRRIYLESYGYKNPKYPYKVNARGIYSDYYLDDVVNIKHYSLICNNENKIECKTLRDEALKLIQENYPVELVVDYMNRAKLKKANGDLKYTPGFLTFLSQFPDMRAKMVSKDISGNEVLDRYGIEVFPQLFELFNYDKDAAYKFLEDCRIYHDNFFETSNIKYKTAIAIFKKTGKWTEEESELIRSTDRYNNSWTLKKN